MKDSIKYKAHWRIFKFKDPDGKVEQSLKAGKSLEEVAAAHDQVPVIEHLEANLALNEGIEEVINLVCGIGTPTAFDHDNAYIGVGDSNTAASASQTGLQALTNKAYAAMDTSYPSQASQTATWRATFGSGVANFSWEEFTIINAATDTGKNLNRKVESKGTKVSGETWTIELSIVFS